MQVRVKKDVSPLLLADVLVHHCKFLFEISRLIITPQASLSSENYSASHFSYFSPGSARMGFVQNKKSFLALLRQKGHLYPRALLCATT